MDRAYFPLTVKPLKPGVVLSQPESGFLRRVGVGDPAIKVMTDLFVIPVATIESARSVDQAHELMKVRGVRLLFILGPEGEVVGLVTATDVLGEKSMNVVRERGIRHSEVRVTDIMTPASMFEAIDFEDVLRARVGQIIATLKQLGRQHLMVAEFNRHGTQTIRGLFSVSQIARQLGIPLQATEVATTFAEIERALGS